MREGSHPRLASAARTSASLMGTVVAAVHSRAVTPSKLDLPASSATRSPAMISSPFWPSTWERAVSAAATPSSPMGDLLLCNVISISSAALHKRSVGWTY